MSFLNDCVGEILTASGFGKMDDEAREGLADYLLEVVGSGRTREEYCTGDSRAADRIRTEFFCVLRVTGMLAGKFALERIERATGKELLGLALDDMQRAERAVAVASSTGLCEP